MSDPVNHPPHYNKGSVECIDAIRSATLDAFPDYCVGNSIKYTFRWRHKGGVEDLRKAIVYLQWAVDAMEANTSETPKSCEPANNPVIPDSCEPPVKQSLTTEKRYRDVIKDDIGSGVEVRDYDDAVWCTRKLIAIRNYGDGWRYRAQNEEGCITPWKQARIEVVDPAEPANNPKTLESCEPEKRYRDVNTGDVGKMIEVKDRTEDNWLSRKLLDFAFGGIYCESPDGSRLPWKYARIEVTE